jgi:hypothetical protein
MYKIKVRKKERERERKREKQRKNPSREKSLKAFFFLMLNDGLIYQKDLMMFN